MFTITMRAFVNSTARRTTIRVASFYSLAEAVDFLTRCGAEELQPGEDFTITRDEDDEEGPR